MSAAGGAAMTRVQLPVTQASPAPQALAQSFDVAWQRSTAPSTTHASEAPQRPAQLPGALATTLEVQSEALGATVAARAIRNSVRRRPVSSGTPTTTCAI